MRQQCERFNGSLVSFLEKWTAFFYFFLSSLGLDQGLSTRGIPMYFVRPAQFSVFAVSNLTKNSQIKKITE
jgi:hypothetical protein